MKSQNLFALVCLALVLCSHSIMAQEEVSDREVIALLELKSRTKGHLWTNQWDLNKPVKSWYGVKVQDGKVVGLDLSNNNLHGKIPITIGNLKHLETLNLSGNNIRGRVPGLFRKFQELRVVNLSDNALVGHIPSRIDRLKNLEELDLNNNKLRGELPTGISELAKLKTLALANNDLEGAMPKGMEKMKKLKRLYLSNNGFSDLAALRTLSEQQLVLTDFQVQEGNLVPVDFSNAPEGFTKLKFEDEEDF